MASAKLEVFEIHLSPYESENTPALSFRQFFEKSYYSKPNDIPDTDTELFLDYFQEFIRQADRSTFYVSKSSNKAFTAYDTNPKVNGDPTITPHTEGHIIDGTVEGGKYGRRRNHSSLDNKTKREKLNNRAVILDTFYFLLYTPLHSSRGFLIVHGYTGDTISDLFVGFVRKFFSTSGFYHKAKAQRYVPEIIKDEFRNGSYIKKFSFSTTILRSHLSNSATTSQTEEFNITIQAASNKKIPKKELKSRVEEFGNLLFGSQESPKKLSSFRKGKVYLRNDETKRETPFDIKSNFQIKPTIYLEGRVKMDSEGIPVMKSLKKYCFQLLEQIKEESDIMNGAQEI